MYVRKHINGNNVVLSVCDEDIIGKKFEEWDLQLDINKSFFCGELKSEDEVEKLLRTFGNINIVGKKSVGLALGCGVVDEVNVKYIGKIPFVIIFGV